MRDRARKLARVDAQIERTLKKRRIEIEERRLEEVTIREFPAAAKRAVLADFFFHLYNTERKSLEIKMLPASILNICIEENTDMIVEYRTRWAATGGIFEWFKCEGFSYTNGNAEDRGVIIDKKKGPTAQRATRAVLQVLFLQ